MLSMGQGVQQMSKDININMGDDGASWADVANNIFDKMGPFGTIALIAIALVCFWYWKIKK